jgi:hypothetical protein
MGVSHTELMHKLRFYGITRKFKSLINSYLTGRQQRVVFNDKSGSDNMSNWMIIKCGVPQGSILGPVLFLLYINDLPKIINKEYNIVQYVDDTSIIITYLNKLNFETNINRTFDKVNAKFSKNLIFGISI